MTSFYLAAAVLLGLAFVLILYPLLSKRLATVSSKASADLNLAVLRDQLRELEQDKANGIIDQAAWQVARHELEVRVVQDVSAAKSLAPASSAAHPGGVQAMRGLALFLSCFVLLMVFGLYRLLGTPAALDPANLKPQPEPQASVERPNAEQIDAMLAKLVIHLQQQPDDAKGWAILARSQGSLGRFTEANASYAKLLQLQPDNPDALADAADVLAMSQGQTLAGEPEKLLQRALKINPAHLKAQILYGSARYEAKDYAAAVEFWQAAKAQLPPGSEAVAAAENNIRQAQALRDQAQGRVGQAKAGEQGVTSSAANSAGIPAASTSANSVTSASAKSAASHAVSGRVVLDAALTGKVASGDTVFILARAPEGGPRFPLAVLRKQVADLPLQFTLDDTLAMMPEAKLSGFPKVVLVARISKSGNPLAQPGDLESVPQTVETGKSGIALVINTERK